jgi:hypothetical protein
MRLSFTIPAGPHQGSHSRVRVPRDSWPHFTVWDSRLTNLEGQVPVFISPRNRVARLYPQALGSLYVASYDSQGYGGGIRPRLLVCYVLRYKFEVDLIQPPPPPSASSRVCIRCRSNSFVRMMLLRSRRLRCSSLPLLFWNLGFMSKHILVKL